VIPLTGSRTLVQNLARDMGLKTTTPYRVWFEGQQVTNRTASTAQGLMRFYWMFVFYIVFLPNVRSEDGRRCTEAARCPSPPSGAPPTRRPSRSPDARSFSSGRSCRASLCLKPSRDQGARCSFFCRWGWAGVLHCSNM
jgi:hypothetical protein